MSEMALDFRDVTEKVAQKKVWRGASGLGPTPALQDVPESALAGQRDDRGATESALGRASRALQETIRRGAACCALIGCRAIPFGPNL